MTPNLSEREIALLLHIAAGRPIKATNKRGQSSSAANMRYRRLYDKLGVSCATHAVYRAVSLGVIPPERVAG